MKFVIQRANLAKCRVDGKITGQIQKGYCVFIGIGQEDTREIADKMISKMLGLRIFSDENDKINLSLKDVEGSLLLISQFTLYANCKKGNRPSFTDAAKPELATELYEYIIQECQKEVPIVETGIFGANMKIELENDGPFTIILDSKEILPKGF